MQQILVTGAAGSIGSKILPALKAKWKARCLDMRPVPGEPDAIVGDLGSPGTIEAALAGVETVVHLAANSSPASPFERLVGPNLQIPTQLFLAAAQCGVRRIVFASSCHTILGYPFGVCVDACDPPHPTGLYGASKVYCESLGRHVFDKYGIDFIALRIGSSPHSPGHVFRSRDRDLQRKIIVSERDLAQAFVLAVEAPSPIHLVAHVTSRPEREFASLRTAREGLGYEPMDGTDEIVDAYLEQAMAEAACRSEP